MNALLKSVLHDYSTIISYRKLIAPYVATPDYLIAVNLLFRTGNFGSAVVLRNDDRNRCVCSALS